MAIRTKILNLIDVQFLKLFLIKNVSKYMFIVSWRPPCLSELTLIYFNMELSHLGSEASNLYINNISSKLINF